MEQNIVAYCYMALAVSSLFTAVVMYIINQLPLDDDQE